MAARFEIVRTDGEQPWHARFVATNGRIIWTTEQYGRERAAWRAVALIESALNATGQPLDLRCLDERTS